ncbi:S1C family serine protease [Sphingomonas oligophenolica]|uniref:PDZ domain-containing protein n=1 Tax=Sphingomonas oligophenolica TaxID=301154 RepID=A0A502C169_9SPHN|nr:trypsin-like peptidase domain-containing protein [Sphingomonas oligophenolica]TPG06548.1 PDZ domain-containing protein [Sphingomonas oligophenolica]
MNLDRISAAQVTAASLVALTLLVAGAIIGAIFWPRVVKVERRVVAPAMNAAGFVPAIQSVADLVQQKCPAIVAIEQEAEGATSNAAAVVVQHRKTAQPVVDGGPQRSVGFLVSADGYVVANGDRLGAVGTIHILLNDGRVLDAMRMGSDPVSGLSLLKIEASGLSFLSFAGPSFPRVGDWSVAIASPNGSGCTATVGTVSGDSLAEGATLRTFVRLQPSLDPSMAGAPLFNLDGAVMGIAGGELQDPSPDEANSILPAGTAQRIVSQLLRSGKPTENQFGIVADDLTPNLAARIGADRQRGAVVSLIEQGSSADIAGLRAGDVILAVNSTPVSGASELARALDAENQKVSLDVVRKSGRLVLTLEETKPR